MTNDKVFQKDTAGKQIFFTGTNLLASSSDLSPLSSSNPFQSSNPFSSNTQSRTKQNEKTES